MPEPQKGQKTEKAQEARDKASGEKSPEEAIPAVEPGKRTLIAMAAGAIALIVVMAVMLMTARQAPAPPGGRADSGGRRESPEVYARRIKIENISASTETGALGLNTLKINGYVINSGAQTVAAADLRCHFTTNEDARSYFDFPLVIDTSLDDLGDGPLGPMSGRSFAVMMGDFPGGAFPTISHVEVINIRLKKG